MYTYNSRLKLSENEQGQPLQNTKQLVDLNKLLQLKFSDVFSTCACFLSTA